MAVSSEGLAARRRHLVEAAQALIREQGDAGFSMMHLAARAGVSPATPYNLLGSKAEILRLVIRDDFDRFIGRLKGQARRTPLAHLIAVSTDLIVKHHHADRQFHRGLYRAAFSADAADVRDVMSREGRELWRGLVQAAVDSGELAAIVRVGPLTDVLLRTISSVSQGWLVEGWKRNRLSLEMALSVRLVLASVAATSQRDALVDQIADLQADLERVSAIGAKG